MITIGCQRGCTAFRLLLSILVVLLGSSIACLPNESQPPPRYPVSREARNAFPELNRLIDANQLPQARAKLKEQAAVGGENYKTLYYQALILFKEGQYSQSLKSLERAFATQKYDPDLYLLAGLNWVVLNQLELAEPFFFAATQLAPGDFMMHYYLGRFYYTDQKLGLAEQESRKVLELTPTFVKGYNNLGLTLEALGKEEEAIASYRKAIDLNEQQREENEWPYVNLAEFLIKKNRFDEALELVQKAVTFNPRSAIAFYALGEALNKKGKDQEAVKALKTAVQKDPQYSKPHYLLGQIYRQQGLLEEAQKEIQTFQELSRAEKQKEHNHGERTGLQFLP